MDFLHSRRSLDDALLVSQVACEGGHQVSSDEMKDDTFESKADKAAEERSHYERCGIGRYELYIGRGTRQK